MSNPFEQMPQMNENPNETADDSIEQELNQAPEMSQETEAEAGWRKVEEGEVFEPGREFRVNIESGETFVREEDLEGQAEEENELDLENIFESSPEAETEIEQEYSDEEVETFSSDIQDGYDEFAEQPEVENSEFNVFEAGKQFYREQQAHFKTAAEKVKQLFDSGTEEKAREEAREFIDSTKEKAGDYFADRVEGWFKEYDKTNEAADTESNATKKEKLKKLAVDGVDFIPIIGSMKMLAESAQGKTMGGEQMSKAKRLIHTAEGGVFLALDLIGVGAVSKGAKAAKLMTRSSALMRKVGISSKVYKPIFKFGRFLTKNPMAAKAADRAVQYSIKRRNNRKKDWAKKVPEVVYEEQELKEAA